MGGRLFDKRIAGGFPVVKVHDDRRGLRESKFTKSLSGKGCASPALTLEYNRVFHVGFSQVVPDLGFNQTARYVDNPWDVSGCILLRLTHIDDQGSSRVVDNPSILLHADGFDRLLGCFNFLLTCRRETLSESGRRYGQGRADEDSDKTEG